LAGDEERLGAAHGLGARAARLDLAALEKGIASVLARHAHVVWQVRQHVRGRARVGHFRRGKEEERENGQRNATKCAPPLVNMQCMNMRTPVSRASSSMNEGVSPQLVVLWGLIRFPLRSNLITPNSSLLTDKTSRALVNE